METSNEVRDFDSLLDQVYGEPGTKARDELEMGARDFCVAQMIHDARRHEGVTQSELASRIGSSKSYISKIENGNVQPSATLFLRILSALGLRFEVVRPSFTF